MTSKVGSGHEDAGFTLLELLVALALMSTIAATMAAAITQLRPMQRFQERLDETRIASTVVDAVARDIQAAERIPLIEGGSTSSFVLKGEPHKVVFMGVVATGYQRRGLREVSYELIMRERKNQLVRTVKLRRFSKNDLNVQVDELFSGPVEFRLRYLFDDGQGHQEWRDQFSEVNVLPKAVSIMFSVQQRGKRSAERIVVLRSR